MAALVRPIRVTTDILDATNVAAEDSAWNSGTTYAEDARVNRNRDGQGRRWISAQNSNTNHDPATDDGTWWTDDGPSLPWLMFGESATRQSTAANTIEVTLDLPATERVDTAWFGNLSGTALRLIQTDDTEGVVFDETYSLVSDSGITDWWAWTVEPIARKRELLITDLLAGFSGSTLDLEITEAGATVGCGAMVIGISKSLGATQWNAAFGIRDYSVYAENAFGDEAVVPRAYKKTATFTTMLDNSYVDELHTLLAGYRATPVLFIGHGSLAVSAVWGFASFNIEVPGPTQSFCSLDVRSRAQ